MKERHMDLILWRHAQAEEGFPDLARQLTEKGQIQAEKMAQWLRTQLPKDQTDTTILVSPSKRTQQTASALSHNFETVQEIGPGASANQILAAANWPYAGGTAIVVGHQPTLGETALTLLTQLPAGLTFKKGAVWWFRYQKKENAAEVVLLTVKYPSML